MADIPLVVAGGIDLIFDNTTGRLKVRGLAGGDVFITLDSEPVVPITDKSGGGAIGTAAATVDIASSFDVAQSTSSQTLTIPNPTRATTGKEVIVSNTGAASFTMLGATVASGGSLIAKWTGAAWSKVS